MTIRQIHPWGPKVSEYVPGSETDIRETFRKADAFKDREQDEKVTTREAGVLQVAEWLQIADAEETHEPF